ncbi:hypothetical protein ACVJBD_004340 [Rhizobium mongolense]
MHAFFITAVPLAGRRSLLGFLLALAAGADAIEIFGIESHDGANYGPAAKRRQELTNTNVAGLVGTPFLRSNWTKS